MLLKHWLTLFILTLTLNWASGQSIVAGEYFIDAEPGIGNGIALTFTPGDTINLNFSIDVSTLNEGIHYLHTRFRNEDGLWGINDSRSFYIIASNVFSGEPEHIIAAEYFIDTDPGLGAATQLSINTIADSLQETFSISINDLSPGLHYLFIRVKGDNGIWSTEDQRPIYVLPAPQLNNQIVSGEFFIDTEPGIGNGIPFSFYASADSLDEDISLTLPALSLGSHILYIRIKNESGDWSMLEPRPLNICETYGAVADFSVEEFGNLVQIEYGDLNAISTLIDFGDGVTSDELPVNHSFNEAGIFTITLQAHNSCGSDTSEYIVTVEGVESVFPHVVSNESFASLTLHGFGFIPGTTFYLIDSNNQPLYPAAIDIISGTEVNAVFDFTNVNTGFRSVIAEIPGQGQFTLSNAVEVINGDFNVDEIEMTSTHAGASRTGRRVPAIMHIQNNNYSDAVAIPVVFRDISDVQQILLQYQPPLTDIPFFASAYSYLLEAGASNTVMESYLQNEETNSALAGFILPKIGVSSSYDVPMYYRRTVDGTHKHGSLMLYPQLNASSMAGEPVYQNEICSAWYVKEAAEFVLGTSFDQSEWLDCYNTWNDSLYKCIAEMALDPAQSSRLVSLPAAITSVLTHMASNNCISNFPILTTDDYKNICSRVITNYIFLNHPENIAPHCSQIQGLQTSDHENIAQAEDENRENEFCEIAQSLGGNSMLSFGGRANQWCALFGSGFDPNVKTGPGNNDDDVFVNPGDMAAYTISFENDPEASAPVEIIHIVDTLESGKFDYASFRWGPITLGDSIIVSPNSEEHHQLILQDLRPELPYFLMTELDYDTIASSVEWSFVTLDTLNLQPIELELGGFLPPNVDGTEGIGDVCFFIHFSPELTTGDSIRNRASITFDFNSPIVTDYWMNKVDITAPESAVDPLPAFTSDYQFLVNWQGSDAPAGIRDYTVFVSENDGPFIPWIVMTDTTNSLFNADGLNNYKFYSVAVDRAGNWEEQPADPWNNYDAAITVISSIHENQIDSGISLYPVPAEDYLMCELLNSSSGNQTYSIFDMNGKMVWRKENISGTVHRIDIADLSSGIYQLEIRSGVEKHCARFVVK